MRVKPSLSKNDNLDLILLTVKAYDTEVAARTMGRMTDRKVPILTLQNGLGNVETLQRHVPSRVILAGTTVQSALTRAPGDIVHTGTGTTWIGELDHKITRRSLAIAEVFERAGFKTEVSNNIEAIIWSKAIVNSAVNPISALAHVPNGELIRRPQLNEAVNLVVAEGSAIAKSNGLHPRPNPKILLDKVLRSASKNRSSMLQDLEAGRETEIHQINGWISRTARRLGVPSPFNDILARLIIGQKSSRTR